MARRGDLADPPVTTGQASADVKCEPIMPRRRAPDETATRLSPEVIWLAMAGRMATSVAAAKPEHDFAGAWLHAMLELADAGVDGHEPSAVRQWVTGETLGTLRREADCHDFLPWVISGCAPTGEGFARWRTEFSANTTVGEAETSRRREIGLRRVRVTRWGRGA